MSVELKVPTVGESITEVQIGEWLKTEGDSAQKDENLVEIETDKATIELPAPVSGRVIKVLKRSGEMATVGEVIGYMEEGVGSTDAGNGAAEKPAEAKSAEAKPKAGEDRGKAGPAPQAAAAAPPSTAPTVMPAAQRELAQQGLKAEQVAPSGPGGRLLKEDVQRHVAQAAAQAPAQPAAPAPSAPMPTSPQPTGQQLARTPGPVNRPKAMISPAREEEEVPMSPLRRRIAERLVEAQQTAALLTTFNEVEMTGVMALRQEHKDSFQQKYGVKLGFMSFFVKAAIEALKATPALNAEIRGQHIVYHNYYDIGIAVSSAKGLVVPILRNAERMSFAEVELAIEDFARRARDNKIKLEELEGGTFTISNGGVFGSMLSTPIVNPPQSGILGLHAIQERPVARDGQVVIRPMMYLALTYDHRIVDGREAVTFLRRIKEGIEQPARLLLEI